MSGLRELPCIEKIADDAETLELALVENLQRKDLTPFEEAEGLHRLAAQFDYTHDDIARKIGKARSSVTETLSLRNIPDPVRKRCLEKGIVSKSLLLQVARQPSEKKMLEAVQRISQGGLSRDELAGVRGQLDREHAYPGLCGDLDRRFLGRARAAGHEDGEDQECQNGGQARAHRGVPKCKHPIRDPDEAPRFSPR